MLNKIPFNPGKFVFISFSIDAAIHKKGCQGTFSREFHKENRALRQVKEACGRFFCKPGVSPENFLKISLTAIITFTIIHLHEVACRILSEV